MGRKINEAGRDDEAYLDDYPLEVLEAVLDILIAREERKKATPPEARTTVTGKRRIP